MFKPAAYNHRLNGLFLILAWGWAPQPAASAIEEQNIPPAPPTVAQGTPVLTRAPESIEMANAAYPPELLDQGIGGEVRLTIDIDPRGETQKVEIISTTHPAFGSPAMVAATRFRFTPAEIDGRPSPIRIEYRYVFEPLALEPDAIAGEPSTVSSPLLPANFQGLVREAGNRRPVPGAIITIAGRPVTQTDDTGRFVVRGVPTGSFSVKVESPYHETYATNEELQEQEGIQVRYYLVRTSTNPFEVVVRTQTARREVSKVQLQRQEVSKVPGTFGDPVRVIENLPGLGRTPGGLGGALLVRGERPSATGFFLDGVPIPLLYHFGGLTSVINAEFLERVDFYPGGFSARYGDATAGIVEVHSRDLNCDLWRGTAEVDFVDSGAFTCVPAGQWQLAAAGRRSYYDLFLPLILNAANPDEDNGSFTLSPVYWDYQVKGSTKFKGHQIDIFAFGANDRLKVIQTGSAENLNYDFKLLLTSHHLLARHRWTINDHLSLTSSVAPGYALQKFTQETLELDSSTEFRTGIWSVDWREQLTWRLDERLILHVGLDHRMGTAGLHVEAPFPDELRSYPGPTFDYTQTASFSRSIDRFNQAYWVELVAEPWSGLRLTPGLRVERWDFHHTQDYSVMPRATARWEFLEGSTAKAAYGWYEKLPEPNFLIDNVGNPNLPPERSHHFIVGFEQNFSDLVSLDLQGFYNLRSNIPSPSNSVIYKNGRAVAETFDSDGTGRAFGLEVLLRHLATADGIFYGWLAYTLSRSTARNHQPGATYTIQQSDAPPREYSYSQRATREFLWNFDQTHILTIVGQWVLPWGLEAGFRFRLVSGNPFTPLDRGRVYFDVDRNSYRVDLTGIRRNSDRLPIFHQLDIRIDKTWTFRLWKLTAYLELINAYYRKNVEQFQYDYRYENRVPLTLLPILPILGVKGEF